MAKEVCKIFQDVDEYFINNKPDFDKINKIGNYMQDCYNNNPSEPHKCKEDLQGIKALCSYLFTELHKISKDIQKRENNDNQYVEYVMIWLGYRLFQAESYSSSTLRNFYNNNLMKSDLFNNYTDLIKKKEHLKDVNLYYMKRFYELFKEVCYMALRYSKNNLDMNKIQRKFNTFQNKYRILYNNIEECNSYLILLNSIKVAYDHFKRSLIKSIPNHQIKELHANLKDLTPRIRINKSSTSGFNSRGCKNVNSRATKKISKPAPNVPKPKLGESSAQPQQQKPAASPPPLSSQQIEPSTQSSLQGEHQPLSPPLPPNPQVKPIPVSEQPPAQPTNVTSPPVMLHAPILSKEPANPAQIQSSLQKDNELQKTQTGGSSHKNESEDSKSGQMSLDSGKGIMDGGGGEKGGASTNKGDSGGTDNGPIGTQDDQGKSSGGSGNGPGDHGIKGSQEGSGDQSNTDSQTKHPENAPSGKNTTPSTGPHNGVRNNQDNPKTETNNLKGGIGSQPVGQDDKQENKNGTSVDPISGPESPGGKSKDGAQEKTNNVNRSMTGHQQPNPQGDSNQKGDPSQQGGSSQQGDPDTSEGSFGFASSFLSLLSNGTKFFNRASDFIDQNQQRFNDAKNKISGAYKDAMDNLKIVYNASSIYFSDMINSINNQLNQDDPPKSGNSGDKLPQSNDQSQKTGDPLPPQPLTPPKDPTPITSQDPSSPPPEIIPPDSSQQNQSPPQLQSTTVQTPQVSSPTQKTTDQLVKSPSPEPILRTPWNIFPTTWNGSGNCKPEIKFMNTTLVCCTSEQCSLTGITVTLVLIPIILLIAYKYLSFGSSKKSEKKNMKRVIKLVDGSKKTQIIINSYYRKKDLKPVINSVGKKKDPLLNIYKLMKADPIPFINVFFLLIFFVYKRKENFLEL
ncbi:PIR protein CIR protein [Plasmodium vinckei]|uniref:PIR protein CIR protein n=1 Tax=Plasmodium vinckei TaxID=5860 RepID=A0A6V7T409_PLAVN|nr:PIR protein CIR protein [Plasmodium vinckei]